ncbi:glycosyltransferase family 1 protein [Microbacterium protaetiae]|uniref:Glycosyltransferase family 1 protein n=1 Tax=Microbacterium protaetiae TaxID=2509458 RepID=A0A4P6EFL0_9MICO|nr:glycosyltransferase family 1 protein [Microbacterium protaetiae]QAY60606.1 glycosyltransferase family 1 protein [Microbacterium protaetiae]
MTTLYVDDRYRGAHGIGRYAREVLARLRPHWQSLDLDGSPHSPLDAFRALPTVGRNDVVYSPGYGALVRAPRQILTIHDLIQLRSPGLHRVKFAAYYAGPVRSAVRKAGLVLTVSQTSQREIREWVRDDSVRVVNAGNGCSAAFRMQGPVEEATDPYVVFVGNLRRHKNLDVVLRALPYLPDVRLRAVIPEREREAAQAQAAALSLVDRVEWLHDVDDEHLAALYRGAAATVMPSTLEGFGLPALESIACGVPVLFWQGCDAVAEIVGTRGWSLASAQDAAEWAAALTEAVAAPRRVEPPAGVHDWDRTADIISSALEQALTTAG